MVLLSSHHPWLGDSVHAGGWKGRVRLNQTPLCHSVPPSILECRRGGAAVDLHVGEPQMMCTRFYEAIRRCARGVARGAHRVALEAGLLGGRAVLFLVVAGALFY
jgi:hypothetical protein